ncbi:protein-disulfide reductase DsbD family protein [Psychromonas sp. 14N.309.X.WAT.B.A12]|uniref:protein-disulfide reductase DsbD family protein n=1 Tax=Psychromonas sp. 14N.309.X.WAT.B.A12 TaxID=2998322 RepID=UPI0025B1C195|nr:protein-disulfide reductase DsbD domain-containing protein [Psychromonas sp. 14N.309.X.WAT.B.A12]MDN2664467.1 protein-disulfide reductase DsbD family protein [Psychromonas sp. 14N.309.X.WAT.B.A12]
MSTLRQFGLSFLLLFGLINSAFAQAPETGWITNFNHLPVKVNLQLTGQAEQNTVNAILNVSLASGWKTYWRSPGEGGVAPTFDWSVQSSNISDVDWSWPTPKRYPVLGVETVGYKDQIHFPMQIFVDDPTQISRLKGTLTLASCTTICVLTDYDINLTFDPQQLSINDDVAFAYAQAVSSVPILVDQSAIEAQKNNANITEIKSAWDQKNQQVVVKLSHQLDWQQPDLFIDSSEATLENVFFSKPVIEVAGKQLTATFEATSWGGEVDLSDAQVNVTAVDTDVAVEIATTLGNQPIASAGESLLSIFFIALLGGLILNIMPCVLPVLGMKLSSVLGVDGTQRAQVRKQFIASSIGIISSFWLLALFLLILKFSGEALGWGIQFQNPYFIGFMVIVTALFTANMLGLFEIQLPSSMQTWLATKGGHSYLGHYLQGMFATLLATPCSAPFLGTAVAFALGASAWQLFAVFTALGIGMALPWLLIAVFPSIATLMPKPGKWMGTVKLIFALLILLTCLWLISLLSSFIGVIYTAVIALLMVVIFAVLIWKKHGKRVFLISVLSLLAVVSLAFVTNHLTTKHWVDPLHDETQWVPLDTQLIKQEVAKGHVVFVDVTAKWCVTCKANKIGVLLQDPVSSELQKQDVIAMSGDWTVRSDDVTAYLQSFGRYGVPFNIVYGPAAPNGIELSTILNSDDVMNAIEQAKGQ